MRGPRRKITGQFGGAAKRRTRSNSDESTSTRDQIVFVDSSDSTAPAAEPVSSASLCLCGQETSCGLSELCDDCRRHVAQPWSASTNGCSSASHTHRRKRMPSAPSMARWSYESDNGSISRGAN